MDTPLQAVLDELAAHFAAAGWVPTGRPEQVLAMRQQPGAGVEHVLFVNEPWLPAATPGVPLLACAVNVHFPALEDCINEALGRDAAESGRQSLRLALVRLAPPAHLVDGLGHDVSAGTATLRADCARWLEPVRRRLLRPDVLAQQVLPPPSVDPWTWHLRRAAWLHLHADAETAQRFLTGLQAQATQWLAEAGAGGQAGAAGRAARRGAEDALALAEALSRPRRRVIPLAPAA